MTVPVSPSSDDLLLPPDDTAAPASPSLPDRADAPVSETSERFLRAVMAEIPLERLEELHMFSPLRQGTVETGIAVLAVRVPVLVTDAEANSEPDAAEPELALGEPDAGKPDAGELAVEAPNAEEPNAEEPNAEEPNAEEPNAEELDVEAPNAAEPIAEVEAALANEPDPGDAEVVDTDAVAVLDRPVRHTVYTARYRHVIKGPERGKWESSVKAEAEAPLITVETVVRGVQRRAGEESEIIRYSASQVAKILRIPFPVAAVDA